MTDGQFQTLIDGLKAFVAAGETGNLRQAFADLRGYVDAISPASPVNPPAVDALPTGFTNDGLQTIGSAPAELAPGPAVIPPGPVGQPSPAQLILRYASLPEQPPQLRLMEAWIEAESTRPDGTSQVDQTKNPLNVTAPVNGSWSWPGQTGFWNELPDGMGVVTFDTLENGCHADAMVLQQSNMNALYAAVAAGDAYRFVTAVQTAPWGTSAARVAQILGVPMEGA